MLMLHCKGRDLEALGKRLNRVFQRALKTLPEKDGQDSRKEQEQLRKSQRAWLQYKSENCALVGGLEGGGNQWVSYFGALCEEKMLVERIKFLNENFTN